MYPVICTVGEIEVRSYYVMWSLALTVAMLWTNKRLDRSGLPSEEATSVITWSFVAMLIGARAFEYIWNWRMYCNNPSLILDFERGGLSEVGAFTSAIFAAMAMCRLKKISFWKLADTTSPAVLLSIAIGRWGCYLNGCCGGYGHPVQLYYSFSAVVILALVLFIENYTRKKGMFFKYGILSPLGLGLYSISRLIIDPLRIEADTGGLIMTHWVLIGCVAASVVWLALSKKCIIKSP